MLSETKQSKTVILYLEIQCQTQFCAGRIRCSSLYQGIYKQTFFHYYILNISVRWKPGVASTLNYIPLNSTDSSPALIPYPNWESNHLTKENKNSSENVTVSIFRIDVDLCDRLWVLDVGFESTSEGHKAVHSPTLIIFDLKTDKVIRRYPLKADQYTEASLFANTVSSKFFLHLILFHLSGSKRNTIIELLKVATGICRNLHIEQLENLNIKEHVMKDRC